jgi:hypothetical protein
MFTMVAGKESGRLHPSVNAETPTEIEREVRQPGDANYLREARIASGGLDDDPTDSGSAVKNRHSSANLQGGR